MKAGIVGLPNVGKSTLFNALTKSGAEAANYPFCTIEPNLGVVTVPDPRLERLREIFQSKRLVPATVSFLDIAGLVRGASKGEGLGNQFLANIRETDAIIHVVRCFEDENVVHVDGHPDPLRDVETIQIELLLADMDFLGRRIEKTKKFSKSGDPKLRAELAFLERLQAHMEAGKPARSYPFSDEEAQLYLPDLYLLSQKPVLYVANIAEADIGKENAWVKALRAHAEEEASGLIALCAQMEEDIASLDADEAVLFLEELGLAESGLDRMIRASYELLGLMSYLTAGPKEIRAWTIKQGSSAVIAAGKIHSDMARGFIRAEIVSFHELDRLGSMAAAKDQGLYRSEGKDYRMQDGDVVLFRFNV